MPAQLLEREAELAAIAARLDAAAAGRGGAAGASRAPPGSARAACSPPPASWRRAGGMRVLRARGAPLEQAYAFGTVRALFEPVRAASDPDEWAALTADAAGARPARARPRPARDAAPGDDATHATLHGLFWLTANLRRRAPARAGGRRRALGRPAVAALARPPRAADRRRCRCWRVLAVRSGEPPSDPALLDDLLADARRRCGRVRSGPRRPRRSSARGCRARAPAFCAACHAATGGNPFLLHALAASIAADGIAPDAQAAATIERFGPEAVAREVARQLDRLPAGAREVARAVAILGAGRGAARGGGAGADLEPAPPRAAATRCATAGAAGARRAARVRPPDPRARRSPPGSGPARAGAVAPARRGGCCTPTAPTRSAQALQLLEAEPDADPTRGRRPARGGAGRDRARRAGERDARTCAARWPSRRTPARGPQVLLECGLALAAHRHPDAPALLHEAIELIPDPPARAEAGLHAARALALAALYDDVVEICRAALAGRRGHAARRPSRGWRRSWSGMAMTRAATLPEARERVERARRDPPPVALWRVNAAGIDTFAGRPAREALALLRPLLSEAALAAERDSLVATVVLDARC